MTRTAEEEHRDQLYELFDLLRAKQGSVNLRDCSGKMGWPERGVYFFFEDGETRPDGQPRVVRVGTHGLKSDSRSTLWGRLRQHRGNSNGHGGNHRGSVFRLHVGSALLASGQALLTPNTWAQGTNTTAELRAVEKPVEFAVSNRLGAMRVLWLKADDAPGPDSLRAYIETHSIRLLSTSSNSGDTADRPSDVWLGHSCPNAAVRASGLWNVRDTTGAYDPGVLKVIEDWIERT